MNYEDTIAQERAKLELLKEKYAFLAAQIADAEQFILILSKRSSQAGGDELDKALERQLASKVALNTHPKQDAPAATLANEPADANSFQQFPVQRRDSIWPYVVRHMAGKKTWNVNELNVFAAYHNLIAIETGLRSTMSSLKGWQMVNNDMPGFYSLTDKGIAFVNSLKPSQYVLDEITKEDDEL